MPQPGFLQPVYLHLQADVAILEEPDHLNWFHAGRRWTHKFRLVLGIVHTNYEHYVRQ